ncbi:MAG: sensor histidine kinase [Nitrospiraceae bacterium]
MLTRLSIFGRLTIGFVAIILIVTAVNVFALYQIRHITEQSAALVSQHYPAIDGTKWLLANLYAQERSEREYLAVGDAAFLDEFNKEAQEFHETIGSLKSHEASQEGRDALIAAEGFHEEYRILVQHQAERRPASAQRQSAEYDTHRARFIGHVSQALQSFLEMHEKLVAAAVTDALRRSQQSEGLTKQLGLVTLLIGVALAGLATYSIVTPLRRLQVHIREIGQGNFRTSVDVTVPSDLRDLVESVKSMGTKLQELDDLKTEFLSHMTHELRSPMTAIHAGTQFLIEEVPGRVNKDQRETLQLMESSSRQLIEMISSLLDLNKLEAGMMQYRMTAVDLMRNVQASIDEFRLLAEREEIRIVVDAPPKPVVVQADDARIQQVIDNLLSNALKFSQSGAVIRLKLEADTRVNMMRVSVSDTGQGIAPDALPHIFERFYQGSGRTVTKAPGSGIGLALAKQVVEAHGGRIWAESELGKGTTLQFLLPLAS